MGWEDGKLDGQDAKVKQVGSRIEAITKTGADHDHIVANDGLNADYVRERREVVVNNRWPNPYGGSPPAPRVINPPC
jgi:hypothetical protein